MSAPLLSDLWTPGVSVADKLIRTLLVYVFLLFGLRLAGKRELSQINPFDLVVLLLLSNTVQNAIIGDDNSLLGGLIGAGALLLLNAIVVRVLYHYGKLETVEGRPDTLIRNGRILRHHLERELITVAELEAAARRQGIASLANVKECRLETGGALSFVQRTPTDDELRHHEVIGLLAQMEQREAKLVDRLAALEARLSAG